MIRFFALFLLLTPLVCFGQVAKVERYNICHYKRKVYRTVRIENYGTIGCDTVYTKRGKETRVGGGLYLTSCDRVFANITSNLEEGDWACTEIKSSGFTVEDFSKVSSNE